MTRDRADRFDASAACASSPSRSPSRRHRRSGDHDVWRHPPAPGGRRPAAGVSGCGERSSAARSRSSARRTRSCRRSHPTPPRRLSIGDRYPDEPVPERPARGDGEHRGGAGTRRAARSRRRAARGAGRDRHPRRRRRRSAGPRRHDRPTSPSASAAWKSAARRTAGRADRERWRAGIDAVPVGEPPWVVRVALADAPGDDGRRRARPTPSSTLRRSPFRVEVYEPRPSWATTFVRRALEADARFEVAGVSFSSRGISVRTGDGAPLSDPPPRRRGRRRRRRTGSAVGRGRAVARSLHARAGRRRGARSGCAGRRGAGSRSAAD